MKVKAALHINAYDVIARAVEEGVKYGVTRAHKHTDNPSQDVIFEAVQQAVLNELCEVLVFE